MRKAGAAVSKAGAELDNYFDIQEKPWLTWETAPFDKLRSWAENLHKNAGGIPAYREYEDAARGLEKIIGNGALDRIRSATDDAKLIPDIVRRALYGGWIDGLLRSVPELSAFNRIAHEGIIDEFRQLDKLQMLAAQSSVQTICFKNYRAGRMARRVLSSIQSARSAAFSEKRPDVRASVVEKDSRPFRKTETLHAHESARCQPVPAARPVRS